ncbi:hemerythrin domain-containing protein [Azospirillum sp. TSO22-1]|uniref:hemerythrin domain-containing protein n=1 Tax=Azospirillum sp. TSO22-1 TaxID=716789 RepID=UPI001FFF933F|nr:hemerythrin domain-containing protein [Azospirillum sp. TSO22-1]
MLHMNSRIGQLLHADHLTTLGTLQELEELLVGQGATPPDLTKATVRAALETLVAVVKGEVSRHFGFEENHLFPVLADAGQTGMTMLLISEHRAILPVAEVAGALAGAALAAGAFTPEDWAEFRDAGLEFCERELFHIQKEEMGLLAAVAALVGPDEDTRLAGVFEGLHAA